MQIKLVKPAQWGGEKYRTGSKHDVDAALAGKLISRGLAVEFVEAEAVKEIAQDGASAE